MSAELCRLTDQGCVDIQGSDRPVSGYRAHQPTLRTGFQTLDAFTNMIFLVVGDLDISGQIPARFRIL
jgi:replicative DNA helicase